MNCKFCGKELNGNLGVLHSHENYCNMNPNRKVRSVIVTDKMLNHLANVRKQKLKKGGWPCKHCNLTFESRSMWLEHNRQVHSEFCSSNKFGVKNIKWVCNICNNCLPSRRSLAEHKRACMETHGFQKDTLGRYINLGSGGKCKFCNFIAKTSSGLTLHEKFCMSNPNREARKGRPLSDEAKVKLSMIAKERVGYSANYNDSACKYIDKLNLEKGWNLQHALNGGEITVGPYYLDGYDAKRNIAFEYDEPAHYGAAKMKHDVVKQNYIIGLIHCEFWRYDEKADKLYKVSDGMKLEDFVLIKNSLKKQSKKEETSKTKSNKVKAKKSYIRKNVPWPRYEYDKRLKEERWEIILNCNIDFTKFGWVNELSKLFGIAPNKAGKYVKKNFPDFYKNCFVRKSSADVVNLVDTQA